MGGLRTCVADNGVLWKRVVF